MTKKAVKKTVKKSAVCPPKGEARHSCGGGGSTGPYTATVMQHFKKPHNYGKIKDADGVGKVGNIVCVLPDEKIHSQNEIKLLEDLKVGDFVLSHTGFNNKIGQAVSSAYQGKIIELKNKLGSVKITPEHLVYAIKPPKGDKYLRTRYRKELVPAWYHSTHLEKGDIVLYPVPQDEKDTEAIEINIPKEKYDFKSIEIPRIIKLDEDILKLFGYFLAEGSISEGKCRNYILFTLHIEESDIVEDIKRAGDRFGLDATVREIPKRKTVTVSLYSATLSRYFKQLFGKYAYGKKIPDFLMVLPPEKQKYLIYGMWKGDGYVNLKRNGARAGFATVSYKIAQQMKVLLLRQGIVPSFYREKQKKVNGVNHRDNYRIHVGQRASLAKICDILGVKYEPKSFAREKSWVDERYLYTAISEVKESDYKGKVCNLEVGRAHSFTTESFCVHNCGDVMWLYIKVAKNKAGKETVKDIKFETFGCVAAIATSSAITDIAKGMALEEAYNIDKKAIVDKLGGLPPIKLHCSVLAADALVEAVYDYYTKKKRVIPADLEEKHQRIQKERDIVEEKYKDWVSKEEQINKHKQ
jgi:nitrogen fixation protein NifU and related proteins